MTYTAKLTFHRYEEIDTSSFDGKNYPVNGRRESVIEVTASGPLQFVSEVIEMAASAYTESEVESDE
ncbi:hypothetical protein [Streptomyces griseus]|uniref:hypothetical protein n=1 Tax=Streptomyces griseus TaxID=1911 RepID=UPI0033C2EE5C